MATFPSIQPTYGVQKTSQPRYKKVQFADGYEQRIAFGLLTNPKTYSLTFVVSESQADTIETFLDARAADQASFTFTPPGASTSGKYVCDNWTKSIPYLYRATISATFRQVFLP